ncbi:MAG: hypothetical protein ACRCWF_13115 [Beijerinckiaceae bacterium]
MNRFLATAPVAVIALFTTPSDHFRLPEGPSAAYAQQAVTLENLTFKGDMGSVKIPRIVVEGSTASKADIEALFDTKSLNTLATRLAKFSARSVTIPTLEIVQTVQDSDSTTVYKDVVMRDIQNGMIAELVTPFASVKTKVKPNAKAKDLPAFDIDMNNMVMKGTDLPLMLRFAFDKAADGETLKTAMAEQTVGKVVYRVGDMGTFTIQSMSAKDFKLKPLRKPFIETVTALEKNSKDKTKSKDADKDALDFLTDLLTAMSFGSMDMNGMNGEFKVPGEAKPVKLDIQKIAMAGGADVPGRFTMQGFKTSMTAGSVNVGEITVDGVTLGNMVKALQSVGSGGDFSDLNPADFVPKMDLIRFSGIDIDVPDTRAKDQRVKAKLGLFETKMSNHVGPIPANVMVAIDRFQMDLPKNTKEKGLNDLIALGYNALDVSLRYDQTWDQTSKVLKLNELSMRSAGMFATKYTLELGNVSKEIFTLDKAVAAVAALGVTAKSLDANLTNEGLAEKLLAQQATQQKRKPEDLRAELAAGATMMVPMMMGDHPAAKTLGTALGQFVAQPKNLSINVKAKDAGLGAADFIAVKNPMDLLKKVDITAVANK